MTARTPRTTREEREGLRVSAAAATPGVWVHDGEGEVRSEHRGHVVGVGWAVVEIDGGVVRNEDAHWIVAANPTLVARLLADLRDAEAERDAAAERAERAEAAVGRVREVLADEWRHEPPSTWYPEGRMQYRWPAELRDQLTTALDPATDAETGRGGAGRGSAGCADAAEPHGLSEADWADFWEWRKAKRATEGDA